MARGRKKENLTPEERLQAALVPESEQPYKVPGNWCWIRGSAFLKSMETKHPEGEVFRYIDIDAIDNKKQQVTEPKTLLVKDAPSRASRKLKTGDTIFSMVRPYLMNIAYIDETISNSIASTGFYVCTPAENVNPLYLYYLMTSPYTVEGLNRYMKGDNSPSIRKDDIENYPYPIPAFAEQQRIVDRIENLFTKLDEAKQKAQDVLDSFEPRKAAILHKAFTGELTAQWRKAHRIAKESWIIKPLSKVTNNHDSQRIPLSQAERSNLSRIYDYYGASGVIDKVDRFIFEGKKLLIGEDGANLVTRSKPIAFIAEGQYWVNNHAHVLSTTSEMLLDFLCYYINSIDLTPYVTGSAQPKMTQAKMNKIPIPVPMIDEQTEIVRILDDLLAKEQQAKEAAEKVLEQIDLIKKSILARAFRGELGTNDPSEESAVELLRQVLSTSDR